MAANMNSWIGRSHRRKILQLWLTILAALATGSCANDGPGPAGQATAASWHDGLPGKALTIAPVMVTDHALLSDDTGHRVDYRIIESASPGSTVMIVAGMHGNEPAGFMAADEARRFVPLRGTVVVVARANSWCVDHGLRLLPPEDPYYIADPTPGDDDAGNLDRCFPEPGESMESSSTHGGLARALWQLVVSCDVEWLLNCHESREYRYFDAARDGQTILHHEDPRDAQYLADRLNADLARLDGIDPAGEPYRYRSFRIAGPPVSGSLTRAVAQVFDGASPRDKRAFTIETTRDSDLAPVSSLEDRVRQQKRAMKWLLVRAGLIDEYPRTLLHTRPRTCDGPYDVSWEAAGGMGPFEYVVETRSAGDGPWTRIYTGPDTLLRFTTGIRGLTYSFRVAARASDRAAFGEEYGPWAVNEPREYHILPDADATLRQEDQHRNDGNGKTLRIDADPLSKAYLRFTVRDVQFPAAAVRLWLYYSEGSADSGGNLRLVGENAWEEADITYANRPLHSIARYGTLGPVGDGVWRAFDITPVITGTGVCSFALVTDGADGCSIASREAPGLEPFLEIVK